MIYIIFDLVVGLYEKNNDFVYFFFDRVNRVKLSFRVMCLFLYCLFVVYNLQIYNNIFFLYIQCIMMIEINIIIGCFVKI